MSSRLLALSLSFFLLSSVVAAPASAQAADDPKQPSVENPHMHFWGTDDLSSCWTHFDSNDSAGSSEEGHGAMVFAEGQQVDVSFTCRIQENFKENMYLNPNGTIVIEVGTRIFSDDCDPEQDSNCKDFTMTLYRGNIEVAKEVFPGVSTGWDDEQIRWELPVNGNMTSWNRSQEEPALHVEFSKPGVTDILCAIPLNDCTGEFWFYYSNNEDGMTAEANFPVINMTDLPIGQEEPGEEAGGGGGLPGFGLAAGLGAMALAAVAARSREE
ncbi:MAG: hypothetical protein QGH38_01815 [Candidatus Thalassarchaeaceae archaeon]|jgi:hypothetical protein|nr:hypothetical protein [Candidatus Thalassarchaeaceae archaeon]